MTHMLAPAGDLSFVVPRTRFRRRSQVQKEIARSLKNLHEVSENGLHLGAGGVRIKGVLNCDYFDERAEAKVNALSLDDYADRTVDLIEHHHMVEHLSFEEFDAAMREWSRALRDGGYLIMTFPDIFKVCSHYLGLRAKGLFLDTTPDCEYAIKMLVGSQEHEGMFHKNHFDLKRVKRLWPEYGFKVEFSYPYPKRSTPSLLVVATKNGSPA